MNFINDSILYFKLENFNQRFYFSIKIVIYSAKDKIEQKNKEIKALFLLSTQISALINKMYAVVGVPSQPVAVLNFRREARITRKYSSFVISITLQLTSL